MLNHPNIQYIFFFCPFVFFLYFVQLLVLEVKLPERRGFFVCFIFCIFPELTAVSGTQ